MTTFNLKGKTALVTGSNRGIGEAFVQKLLEAGAGRVYAGVRDPEYLHRSYPDGVKPVLLDVTNSDHIATLAANIDGLDILVNNAGVVSGAMVTGENALDITRAEMEVNLFGPMALTQAMLPVLKKSSQAAIINISSIAALSNFPSIGPYSITKAAMRSYIQGLRADLSSEGVQVVGVYPGPTDTRMTEGGEMPKAPPAQIAAKTFAALASGEYEVFPDDFSASMHALFLKHPAELESAFAQMQ